MDIQIKFYMLAKCLLQLLHLHQVGVEVKEHYMTYKIDGNMF